MSTEAPVKKKADRKANGRGSIYKAKKSNGKEVIKAAIYDINAKRRPKNFTRKATAWTGKLPAIDETITVCLGYGVQIYARPCMCWTHHDTSRFAVWREHNHRYTISGNRIYEKNE